MNSGVVAMAAFLACCATAAAQDECGTVLTPQEAVRAMELDRAGVYELAEAHVGGDPIDVPVTFHVVRQSNGTGGLSESRLAQALVDANGAYTSTGIQFCQVGPTIYIDSDAFYFDINTQAEADALRTTNPVPNTINVYCTENLPFCGQSSFTFSNVQGILQLNACTGTSSNPSTFPHELGHYFDLFHTHTTSFGVECVSGSNCSSAGDQLCDTPADPNLSGQVSSSCLYVGGAPGPCGGDPPYNPDPANYMSYSLKLCRVTFSPQQQDKAYATLVNLRPELIAGCCEAVSPRLYVNSGVESAGCGASWVEAVADLRSAFNIALASGGLVDEIWVAAGTYKPSQGDREVTFQLINGISVYGGFVGVETEVDQRDWTANETILNGDLNGDDGPDFANYLDNTMILVTGDGTDGTAVLDGFIIEAANADGSHCGGGVSNYGGSPTVANCIFRSNLGTAMCNTDGSATVINCTFRDNAGGFGGAMNNQDSFITVINSAFLGNVATASGGGIYNFGGAPTFINCTITGNTGSPDGGGLFNILAMPTVANTIAWGNAPNDIVDEFGSASTVSYSDVQGGWAGAGTGNIDADPLLVDPDTGDVRLSAGSPCIDAALNTAVPVGITNDLDGNPRFVDDPGTPDCPQAPGTCGTAPIADMGAYEVQAPPCPWDCADFDGNVGIVDFLALLAQWGGPGTCDFDGGGVGIVDFLKLLGQWGACP